MSFRLSAFLRLIGSCDEKMEVVSSYIESFRGYCVLYPFAECIYISIDSIPSNSNDVAGGMSIARSKVGLNKPNSSFLHGLSIMNDRAYVSPVGPFFF